MFRWDYKLDVTLRYITGVYLINNREELAGDFKEIEYCVISTYIYQRMFGVMIGTYITIESSNTELK